MRILVVEDDQKIAKAIKTGLERQSYTVEVVFDGRAAVDLALTEHFDLLILDRMLPEMDGVQVIIALRKEGSHTPILMLTAKDTVLDKAEGLNAGADDYLVKPFAFVELFARVRALLRRPSKTLPTKTSAHGVTLDHQTFSAIREDSTVPLTAKEFSLLEYLMNHPGQVLSKDQIIQQVWSHDADILPNTVEVYIGYLRSKIDKPFATKPPLINTRRGFGYYFGEQ